jgi:hypothetical protein
MEIWKKAACKRIVVCRLLPFEFEEEMNVAMNMNRNARQNIGLCLLYPLFLNALYGYQSGSKEI